MAGAWNNGKRAGQGGIADWQLACLAQFAFQIIDPIVSALGCGDLVKGLSGGRSIGLIDIEPAHTIVGPVANFVIIALRDQVIEFKDCMGHPIHLQVTLNHHEV